MTMRQHTRRPAPTLLCILALCAGVLAACSSSDGGGRRADSTTTTAVPTTVAPGSTAPLADPTRPGSLAGMVPKPVKVTPRTAPFALRADTVVVVDAEVEGAADDAIELLRSSVGGAAGAPLPTQDHAGGYGAFHFKAAKGGAPAESYTIEVTETAVEIAAADHDGYVWAIQSIRQMLAPAASGDAVDGTFLLTGVSVEDEPRFSWRGSMLDVTRHFFTPDEVKTYVDQLSLYKMNRLHLHLSDDQGWRIEIRSHPELTEKSAANEVGGGEGGFYTQAQYRDIVTYAQKRGVTVIPEIDVPGHTNAALHADPKLACDGVAPAPYTGTQVGFSTVCVDKEYTYEWLGDVMGELAEMTPGRWIHLGGDESDSTSPAGYKTFVERALKIVRDHGKTPIGWDEIGEVDLGDPTVVQYWSATTEHTLSAARQGADVVMSPSARTYFDMKYTADGPGNKWAGIISTKTAYDWDPAALIPNLTATRVIGVEAPVWTELIEDFPTVQQRTLPRIPALAEVAWTPQADRSWDDVAPRLAAQAPRWDALGWTYTRDAGIDWE